MSLIVHSSADEPDSSVHQPTPFQAMRQVEYCTAEQLRNILSVTPQINITANGSSMTPFIRNGERVTLRRKENPLSLQSGEIILFANSADCLLLHRIVSAHLDYNNITVQTKGDNRIFRDAPVSPDMIIARVSRLEKELPVLGRCSFNLESGSGILVGRIQALISRLNLFLRLRTYLSKIKNFIPISIGHSS